MIDVLAFLEKNYKNAEFKQIVADIQEKVFEIGGDYAYPLKVNLPEGVEVNYEDESECEIMQRGTCVILARINMGVISELEEILNDMDIAFHVICPWYDDEFSESSFIFTDEFI